MYYSIPGDTILTWVEMKDKLLASMEKKGTTNEKIQVAEILKKLTK